MWRHENIRSTVYISHREPKYTAISLIILVRLKVKNSEIKAMLALQPLEIGFKVSLEMLLQISLLLLVLRLGTN